MNLGRLILLGICLSLILILACGCGESMIAPTPAPTGTPTLAPSSIPPSTPSPIPPTPTPELIRLEPDGSGDYASLEEAVAAAAPGATILLAPGSYHLVDPFDIRQAIHLMGAGMDQTEIVSEAMGYVIRLAGSGPVIVEGITFRHRGPSPSEGVVRVPGGEISFSNSRFSGESEGTPGLVLLGRTTGTVQGCEFVQNGGYGIVLEDWVNVTLRDNIYSENGFGGIGYFEQSGGVAMRNECTDNPVGILISDKAQPTLEGNVCADNIEAGIAFINRSGGQARSNQCWGNGVGIYVEETADPVLEDNDCHDNLQRDVYDLRD